ncbi:hypothetical protein WN943_024601 [Citrus x changshan-huyou]
MWRGCFVDQIILHLLLISWTTLEKTLPHLPVAPSSLLRSRKLVQQIKWHVCLIIVILIVS